MWVKVRVLENRTYESVSAAVYYRTPGVAAWKSLPMRRRVKAVFAAAIPAAEVGPAGLEYYVESNDGDNVARFPPDSPRMALSLVSSPPSAGGRLPPPRNPRADGRGHSLGSARGGKRLLVPDLPRPAAEFSDRARHVAHLRGQGRRPIHGQRV